MNAERVGVEKAHADQLSSLARRPRTGAGLAGSAMRGERAARMRFHQRRPGRHRLYAYASVTIALMLVATPASAQELIPIEVAFLRRIAMGKFVIGALGLAAFVALLLPSRGRSRALRLLAPVMGGAALLHATWLSRSRLSHYFLGSDGHGGIVFAFTAGITLVWLGSVIRARSEGAALRTERGTLAALMLCSVLAFSNFAAFHGTHVVHHWDAFHYFMGSKYFAENGYQRLYVSSILAERDDGWAGKVAARRALDLRSNTLLDASEILVEAPSVRRAFDQDRWRAFSQDIRLFRNFFSERHWALLFFDHGYNATPVWTMFGSALTNIAWKSDLPPRGMEYSPRNLRPRPPEERKAIAARFTADRDRFASQLERLALVDALLYGGMFLLVAWAFGLRASALAMMVWGLGDPWSYYWTGGAFARTPWLFSAVAGVCLVKKGWRVAGGFSLATSFLLRIFPAAIWCGIVLRAGWHGLRFRKLDPDTIRMAAGALLAIGILFSASLWTTGGIGTYRAFLSNTAKHVDTPLVNHMGLATLFSWNSDLTIAKLGVEHSEAAAYEWQEGRRSTFEARKLGFALASLACFGLLAMAVRRSEAWEAAVLGSVCLIVLFELTSYYYCFIALLAPYCIARLRHTVVLLLVPLAGQGVHLLSSEADERFFWNTALALGAYGYLLVDAVVAVRSTEASRSRAAADRADSEFNFPRADERRTPRTPHL
jgi:hypothetical protein